MCANVAEYDVAIVGGGIIGICTAYFLAQQGASVVVLEKGSLGNEQSSRNWGWVRTLDRDLRELPLAQRATALWAQIQSQVEVGFRQHGVLYVARNAQDMAAYEKWHRSAQDFGSNANLLSAEQAMRMTPGSTVAWAGGLYGPTDGVAEPELATRAIAGLAHAYGADIRENCAVRGIDQAAGAVQGIFTEDGYIRTPRVLVAAGAWSRLFCSNLGVKLPQIRVTGSVFRTTPLDAGMNIALNTRDFTFRKRLDGGYTVSRFRASVHDVVPDSLRQTFDFLPAWWKAEFPIKVQVGRKFLEHARIPRRFPTDRPTPFERFRNMEPDVFETQIHATLERLVSTFPQFKQAGIESSWAGYMDITPDSIPVIAPVDQLPGLYLSTGYSGHGFGIGPAAGELTADMLMGRGDPQRLEPFALRRFSRRVAA